MSIESQKQISKLKLSIFGIISVFCYIAIAYFTPRTNFYQLITLFGILFSYYIYITKPFANHHSIKQKYLSPANSTKFFKSLILLGIVCRGLLLFSIPNLSDDFYRFYWDGLLLSSGISPFQYLPSELINAQNTINIPGINSYLFQNLNSPNYYSIYPPVCQAINAFAALLFPQNIHGAVIIMKLSMLLFELGSLFFIIKLLKHFSLPLSLLFIYWLNPLVIVELVGNIHFEAGMICFILGSLYFLSKSPKAKEAAGLFSFKNKIDINIILSAIFLSLAVSTKLVPLILLPFFFKRLGLLSASIYSVIVIGLSLLSFSTMLNFEIIQNLRESIELYFAKFEFNASIYYIARWIGYQVKGWNMIETIGSYFSKIVFLLIMLKAITEKKPDLTNLPTQWMWAITIYLLFATIVHPWYITTLIALAVFANTRFPIIWSISILLSYYTYITSLYKENITLVVIEYSIILVFIGYELNNQKNFKKLS